MGKTRFLSLVNIWYKLLGIWNQNPPTTPYKIYSVAMISLFFGSITREIIQLIIAAQSNHEEANKNMGITLLMIVTLFKVLASRTKKMKGLMTSIPQAEAQILKIQNEKVLTLYDYYVKRMRLVCSCCYMGGILTLLADFIYAILTDTGSEIASNGCQVRSILISAWVPFDRNCHYFVAFFVQCLDGLIDGLYTTAIDNMFLSPMVFVICYLEIIHIQLENASSSENIKDLIQNHQFIIK